MVGAGVEAMFRCQDPTAHVIVWRVNGSTVGQRPPPGITTAATPDGSGTLVNTLTILALLEYNGTEVECEACLLYTSPSPRDATLSRMPSSA